MKPRGLNLLRRSVRLAILLRDSQDFLDGRDPHSRLGPPVVAKGDHAALDGVAADLAGRTLREDQAPRLLGDNEELIDADASPVARPTALVTALAAEELDPGGVGDADGEEVTRIRLVRSTTAAAHAPDQPLGEDAVQH